MVRFEAENHKHVVRVATTFCSFGADCFHDALPPAKAPLCFPVVLPVFMLYILGVMLLGCGGDTSAVSNNTDSGHFADADVGPSTTLDVAADTVPTSDVDDETLDTVIPQADTQDTPVPKCKHGEGCDDNNPCTSDDVCSDGSCAGTPYRCDDGIVCTMDACDGDGGCLHDVVGGACLINTVCYEDGAPNPQNPCLLCVAPISQSTWVDAYGSLCDDNDVCTTGDVCVGGKCIPGVLQNCDDGNVCTDDLCDTDVGCVNAPNEAVCTDHNPCTMGDGCSGSACVPGTGVLACNDGNSCTDDLCAADVGCLYSPNEATCDDGNACTLNDLCGGGTCVAGKATLLCSDGNLCTDDLCLPETGCNFVPNSMPCSDGNECTTGDTCSNGSCAVGEVPKNCDDNNVCTDDGCNAQVGCTHTNNIDPCDDGDVCTLDDACKGGGCFRGTGILVCNDNNNCTDDMCAPEQGCVFTDNTYPCNDANICTSQDVCQNGKCTGAPVLCDDANPCTADSCDPAIGCVHAPISSFVCLPKIKITSPQRAANLDGPQSVTITGNVSSGGGKITAFLINGDAVALDAVGNFSHKMIPKHGMNLIYAEAIDSINAVTSLVQSFYYSSEWTPIDINDPVGSYIEDGLQVWLGQKVIDDGVHDPNNVNDLATLFELIAAGFNLSGLVDGKIGEAGGYKIYVSNLKHGKPKVALKSILGGLHMTMTVPNVTANIALDCTSISCLYIDLNGTVSMTSVLIDMDLLLSVNSATGQVTATAKNTAVEISGLNINISGIVGFLTNWLINFFEGTFADYIESAFVDQVATQLPPIVADALESIAFDDQFTVPPFFGSGNSVVLTLKSALSSLFFKMEGGTIGLFAALVTPKNQKYPSKGAIGRANCLTGKTENFVFPTAFPLQIALHDDVVNELLFGIWWSGALSFPVDPSLLSGVDLNKYGITDLSLSVDFLMPPITTSCNPQQKVKLQIGDIYLKTNLKLSGIPLEMDIYASIEADAQFVVSETPTGAQLGIVIVGITEIATDIVFADEKLLGFKDTVLGLIENQLIPSFVDSLVGGALAGFPLPAIDLSFAPGVPAGTKLELDLQTVARMVGFTLLQGDVK
ncbi:MAG: hypothetical protein HUU55_15300 [Myxococcales bacterium]|nr:hypothetical protein [Myxococcales bacterium]